MYANHAYIAKTCIRQNKVFFTFNFIQGVKKRVQNLTADSNVQNKHFFKNAEKFKTKLVFEIFCIKALILVCLICKI